MNIPTVHFECEGDRTRSNILFENGDSEELAVTKVGPDLYRLEESSFAGDAVYGDVVRCKLMDGGSLFFQEIAERSKLTTQTWVISAEFFDTDRVQSILGSVMAAGGMWEQAFGGLLIVHTPVDIANTVFDQLNDALPTKGSLPKT